MSAPATCPKCGHDLTTPWFDPACGECSGSTWVLDDAGRSHPCPRCRRSSATTPSTSAPAGHPIDSSDRREREEQP